MNEQPSIQDHTESFRDAMRAADIDYRGPISWDGKLHRVHAEGDRKGVRNAWYVAHADGRPAGGFGTWKGVTSKWTAERATPLTPEERRKFAQEMARKKAESEAAERVRQAEAAAAAVKMWDAAEDQPQHPYLERKGVPGYGLRVGTWVKESRPDQHGEIHTTRTMRALLIPIRDERKAIVSLQAIFAEPIKIGGESRGKDFVYGGRKRGCWFTIGKPVDVDGVKTVVICEGYATGASIHMATGLGVVVAFDAGNLQPVAETVRRLMPSARIVIAGDNDAWTMRADKVTPWNPGAEKAMFTAAAVEGICVLPRFSGVSTKPTDFNDLHALEGTLAVEEQIMAAIRPAVEVVAEPVPPVEEEPPLRDDPLDEASPDYSLEADDDVGPDSSVFFTVRGHGRDSIYVFQHEGNIIVERGMADWSEAALTMLAPLHWWEGEFPGEKGMSRKMAVNWLQRTAYKKGFFDPSKCRGRGAWQDAGRSVFHLGDRLIVDGVSMPMSKFKSTFVYEQGMHLRPPADDAMSAQDGKKIVEIARMFNWSRPASAVLLAGWCALAPLCGALRWRPHIWITGGAGSGKSTVLDHFVSLLMGGMDIHAQGNSTEAGIRQTLRTDALPVIYDETEQNNEREHARVQSVIALIRQASTESGARTLKGTAGGDAMGFLIRSMFCLASIQVGMKQQADLERLTVLALRSKKRDTLDGVQAAATWAKLSGALADLRADQELPMRLLRRSLDLLPTTLRNIEIFAQAATEKFGSQREGDQFGAMLAGAWSLVSTKLATLEDARAMIDRYDWSEYTEDTETEESSKALSALLSSRIRVKNGIEVTVYELVAAAAGKPLESFDVAAKEADAVLRRHGMMIKWADRYAENAALLISNNSVEVTRLLESTPYAADVKGQLVRVPGAFKEDPQSFNGVKSRSVGIPLRSFLDCVLIEEPVAGRYVDDDIPF